MASPRGNFRWSGTRWEATSYTAPSNAASYPPQGTNLPIGFDPSINTSAGTSAPMGYAPSPPPFGSGAPMPPGAPIKKTGMIKPKSNDPSQWDGPSRIEKETASVSSIRSQLWKNQLILQEMSEDASDTELQNIDDALYFVREAIEALNKIE